MLLSCPVSTEDASVAIEKSAIGRQAQVLGRKQVAVRPAHGKD